MRVSVFSLNLLRKIKSQQRQTLLIPFDPCTTGAVPREGKTAMLFPRAYDLCSYRFLSLVSGKYGLYVVKTVLNLVRECYSYSCNLPVTIALLDFWQASHNCSSQGLKLDKAYDDISPPVACMTYCYTNRLVHFSNFIRRTSFFQQRANNIDSQNWSRCRELETKNAQL